MSVGYNQTKQDIDNRAGTIALQLRNSLQDAVDFKSYLDGKADADLTAVGYGSTDVTTLRAAFTDLLNLYKVAHAQATQPAVNDFFFNAKNLTGVL